MSSVVTQLNGAQREKRPAKNRGVSNWFDFCYDTRLKATLLTPAVIKCRKIQKPTRTSLK